MTKNNSHDTLTRCARCSYVLMPHEGYDETCNALNVTLCEDCYEHPSINPGEYAYAIKLCLINEFGAMSPYEMPVFWPQEDDEPLEIKKILEIALEESALNIPCGKTCKCMSISAERQASAEMKDVSLCVFHRMENGMRRKALMLYWWLCYYEKSNSHPDFWTDFTEDDIMSPQILALNALGIA